MSPHLILLLLVGTILPGSMAKRKTTSRTTTTTQAGPSTEYSLDYYLNLTQYYSIGCPTKDNDRAIAVWVPNAVAPLDCDHFTNNLAEPPCLYAYADLDDRKFVWSRCDWADGYHNFTMTCYDAVGAMGTIDIGWSCPNPPTTPGTSPTPRYWAK